MILREVHPCQKQSNLTAKLQNLTYLLGEDEPLSEGACR